MARRSPRAAIEKTQPNIFSADETADVGIDNQTPVAEGIGIGAETRFTGKIDKVVLEVSPMPPATKTAAEASQTKSQEKQRVSN